jgi:hypothetical protein
MTESVFGSLPAKTKATKLPVTQNQTAPAVVTIEKKLDQTHLIVGVHADSMYSKRNVVLRVLRAVLSGGIRRSATICIFSADDTEMINAKTGDWFIKNPQRGRSNNSALLIRNETSYDDFKKLMASVREFGEPGFIWSITQKHCTILVLKLVCVHTMITVIPGGSSVIYVK